MTDADGTHRTMMNISSEQHRWLRKTAAERDVSQAEVLRDLITEAARPAALLDDYDHRMLADAMKVASLTTPDDIREFAATDDTLVAYIMTFSQAQVLLQSLTEIIRKRFK